MRGGAGGAGRDAGTRGAANACGAAGFPPPLPEGLTGQTNGGLERGRERGGYERYGRGRGSGVGWRKRLAVGRNKFVVGALWRGRLCSGSNGNKLMVGALWRWGLLRWLKLELRHCRRHNER